MRIKPFLSLLLFSLFTSISFAQNLKFGKFSQEEIDLKEVDFEPGADAVVLAEVSFNSFTGGVLGSDIHRRVKILKESGKDNANVKLQFYAKDKIEDIVRLNAHTVNFDGSNMSITKLEKEDFFEADLGNGWKEVRFSLKNVQQGSILEYSYTKISKSVSFLDPWIFHNDIPTLRSTYTISIPSYFNYRYLPQGEKTIACNFVKGDGLYEWTVTDLNSVKPEPMMTNYADYFEKISFQLAGYAFINSGAYGGESGYKDTYGTWQDLTKFIVGLEKFAQYMKPQGSQKDYFVIPIKQDQAELEKAKEIYAWVQKSISYNERDGNFPSQTLKSLIESKKGSRPDMNLMLMAALKANGIVAYPLMISSKGNGHSRLVDTPFLDQFDQLIVFAKVDGKDYYLDVTNPARPFGYLPLRFHANHGYIMLEEGSGLIPLQITHRSGISQIVSIKPNAENRLVFETNVRFTDYDALTRINEEKPVADTLKAELLGKEAALLVKDFTFSQKSEPRKQLDTKFVLEDEAMDADMQFIKPFTFMRWDENPFQSTTRTFPVDFLYTFSDNYSAQIQIPEGYELDDYPEAVKLTIPTGSALFTYEITPFSNQVNISVTITLKSSLIYPNIYPDLKYFMEILTSKLQEPVVLKKVANP